MFRRHPLFFGSNAGVGGLTPEEQESLMEKEAQLARERDEEQRAFLQEQEKQRAAREEAQRLLTQQEEEARIAELEAQERAGAEAAESMVDEADIDTGVADMFASLAYGTDVVSGTEDQRPE
jgi:hypothetical protein